MAKHKTKKSRDDDKDDEDEEISDLYDLAHYDSDEDVEGNWYRNSCFASWEPFFSISGESYYDF